MSCKSSSNMEAEITSLVSEPYCKCPVMSVSQRHLKRKQISQFFCKPMLKHQYFQCFVQLGQCLRIVSDSANSHEKNGAVETECCTHNVKVGFSMQDFFQMKPCSATSHPSHPRTHKHYLLSSFSACTTMFFLACIHKGKT